MTDNDENASPVGANGDSRAGNPLPTLPAIVVLLALVVLYGIFSN